MKAPELFPRGERFPMLPPEDILFTPHSAKLRMMTAIGIRDLGSLTWRFLAPANMTPAIFIFQSFRRVDLRAETERGISQGRTASAIRPGARKMISAMCR